MLNCCIEKRLSSERSRSQGPTSQKLAPDNKGKEEDDEDEDEENFYECSEDLPEDKQHEQPEKNTRARKGLDDTITGNRLPIWNREASGRLQKLSNLKLLEHDDWLYVPVCQEPTPMTDDMLADQVEVSSSTGTTVVPKKFQCRAV